MLILEIITQSDRRIFLNWPYKRKSFDIAHLLYCIVLFNIPICCLYGKNPLVKQLFKVNSKEFRTKPWNDMSVQS